MNNSDSASAGASATKPAAASSASAPQPDWTYPTRFCRICREDVPATVTMYPPGLPPAFQRPIVEYKNDDEYGRLIKPCLCRGGMRYIHELCLLRSRTETNRAGSMYKCHTCGYKFNFQKLAVQQMLSSKYSSGVLTVTVMLLIMFILGFIADPIINLYVDPYKTVMGKEPIWNEIMVDAPMSKRGSGWAQHFVKGLVSMGLVGFLKTLLLNPFQWWNIRSGGFASSRTSSSTTGRDRAVNISWIAVLIGVTSAFYFFYRWVQTIIQKSLQRIGNNIVDTSLPGDDDDLKPPPGWKSQTEATPSASTEPAVNDTLKATTAEKSSPAHPEHTQGDNSDDPTDGVRKDDTVIKRRNVPSTAQNMAGSWLVVDEDPESVTQTSSLNGVHSQGWSFAGI